MRSMLWQHINCNNGEPIYSVTYREPKNFCISNTGFKVEDIRDWTYPVVLTCVHCGGGIETDLGDVLKVAWYVG